VFIIPMLLFTVLFAAREASDWIATSGRSRRFRVIPTAATTVGLIIPVALVTEPLRDTAPTRGHFTAIDQTCEIVAGGTVVEVGNYLLAMPLRAWCGSAVGIVAPEDAGEALASVHDAVSQTCEPVFVVSRSALSPTLTERFNDVTTVSATSRSSTSSTLLEAPTEATEITLEIHVATLKPPVGCKW
jgi:hypothetical protein